MKFPSAIKKPEAFLAYQNDSEQKRVSFYIEDYSSKKNSFNQKGTAKFKQSTCKNERSQSNLYLNIEES